MKLGSAGFVGIKAKHTQEKQSTRSTSQALLHIIHDCMIPFSVEAKGTLCVIHIESVKEHG